MTEDQVRLFDFIREEITSRGVAPSYPEMMARLGTRSRSKVHRDVTALVSRGMLLRSRWEKRGLQLPYHANVVGIPTELLEAELRRRGRQPAWSKEFRESIGQAEPPIGPPALSATSNWGSPRMKAYRRG